MGNFTLDFIFIRVKIFILVGGEIFFKPCKMDRDFANLMFFMLKDSRGWVELESVVKLENQLFFMELFFGHGEMKKSAPPKCVKVQHSGYARELAQDGLRNAF